MRRFLYAYLIAECYNYVRYRRLYRRFNQLRISRHTARQIRLVADSILVRSPDVFRRLATYSVSRHITDRSTLEVAIAPSTSTQPPHTCCIGNATLHWLYTPLVVECVRRTVYYAGTLRMRLVDGFVPCTYPSEIGDYVVWTRCVPGTKPIVLFPGFGLGAVPYARVLETLGRTVHIVEVPNLGYWGGYAPGYITPESLYRVVQHHLCGVSHDVVAHSLGTSQAAFYVNQQHVMGTADTRQVVVMCDSFVSPVDTMVSHLYPFMDASMFQEVKRARNIPVDKTKFLAIIWCLVHNLHCTVYTKRFHNMYDGTLWRPEYMCRIRYVYGEHDLLFDVPHIRHVVARGPEKDHYLFLPRGKHGACLFGRRKTETLRRMTEWMAE